MGNFKDFKSSVKKKGGIWASDDVYFSQFRDGYSAAYKPNYPQDSAEDQVIYSYGLVSREGEDK